VYLTLCIFTSDQLYNPTGKHFVCSEKMKNKAYSVLVSGDA